MIIELAATATSQSTQHAVGYPSLFLLVAAGSLVPIIPTGAVVSGATVVAIHQSDSLLSLVLVFAIAALAAYLGDLALYWLGWRGLRSRNGSRWLDQLRGRAEPTRLPQAQRRLDEHGALVLVISRLIPAGRMPVMAACLLSRMPIRRFARGCAPAALAWAACYQAIGILGGSLFAEPWRGLALAVGLTLLISVMPTAFRRVHRVRRVRGMREQHEP